MMTVIRSSESDNWKDAVVEWDIDDCEEDLSCSSECVCGKENIKYLYTIRNRYSGRILYPIGSSCINKFGREDLRDATSLIESQFKLLHAVEEGRFDTEYNDYDGEDDYEFMLKMFNKRDKDSISLKQDKKIKALLLHAIKPFLQDRLAEKVR